MQPRPITRRQAIGTIAGAALAGAVGSSHAAAADEGTAGAKLVFHVVSDIHITPSEPRQVRHYIEGLADLRHTAPEAEALVINGDITDFGSPDDYQLLRMATAAAPQPRRTYFNIGNHEFHSDEDPMVLRQRYLDFVDRPTVYYTRMVNGYRFIFLGMEDIVPGEQNPPHSRPGTAVMSQTQLDWLARTLADNPQPTKPIFLFFHQPPEEVQQRAAFEAILRRHPNIVLIWSHWHTDLHWFPIGPDPRLFGRPNGYWRVHTGACAYLIEYFWVNGTVQRTIQWDWAQGIQVEVYDDRVVVRGRDLRTRQWIPGFQNTLPLPMT